MKRLKRNQNNDWDISSILQDWDISHVFADWNISFPEWEDITEWWQAHLIKEGKGKKKP